MRIVGGVYKGIRLDEFKGEHIRPTTDRAKESLFNILENSAKLKDEGFDLKGSIFVDGFCGTGSIGIEALSRGADKAIFIDRSHESLSIAKKNVTKIKREADAEFIKTDLSKKIKKPSVLPNIIFLDPPYNKNLLEPSVKNLVKNEWIDRNCFLILEYTKNDDLKFLENFKILENRKYGKNNFLICKFI